MTKDVSVRAFRCPSCGAPIQPETGTLTMKCPYCSGTVIIPESMRTPPPSSPGPSIGEVFQFGLNGVDLNQIMGNAMHLPQAITLAQQGKVDEAAELYSKITGMEHADALNAVKDMASGRAVSLTPGLPGATWQQYKASYSLPSVESSTPSVMPVITSSKNAANAVNSNKKNGSRSCGIIFAIIAAVAVLIVLLVVGAFLLFSNGRGAGSYSLPGLSYQYHVYAQISLGNELKIAFLQAHTN